MDLLISKGIKEANEKLYTSIDDDLFFAEYNYFCGERIGLSVCGEYDEENHFFVDYYVPFFRGEEVSSYADITVERHSGKESYAGICDDVRMGVSLIFYLQNVIAYKKRKTAGQIPMIGTEAVLAGLSISGKVILPLYKNEKDLEKIHRVNHNRNQLIMKARQGDEKAIETLTLDDMDTYSNITKMVAKEDVLSLVDTYFMPYGVECDQYAIMGEILKVNKVQNKLSKEELWQLLLKCNDVIMEICINTKDLIGEPAIGRRFRGDIWLQGRINYPM